MGTAPGATPCGSCHRMAQRVIGDFQFTEDRTRFFRNAVDGTRFSYSLGQEYPDSRRDRDALFSEKGCEPVTRGTEPTYLRENREYLAHLQSGGDRDRRFEATPPEPPKKGSVTVLSQMRDTNFRVPS